MKKMLSLFLVFVLCFSLAIPAFSTDLRDVRILQDDEEVRVAQSIVDGTVYTSSYSKLNNTVTLSSKLMETGETVSVIVDMNSHKIIVDGTTIVVEEKTISPFNIAKGSGTTEIGFSYNYTSTYCHLARPQKIENGSGSGAMFSLTTVERPSNHDSLNAYRLAVDTISANEESIKSVTGAQKFAEGVTAVLAGPATVSPAAFAMALGTFFAALGFGATVKTLTDQLGVNINTALTHYMDVQYDYESHL